MSDSTANAPTAGPTGMADESATGPTGLTGPTGVTGASATGPTGATGTEEQASGKHPAEFHDHWKGWQTIAMALLGLAFIGLLLWFGSSFSTTRNDAGTVIVDSKWSEERLRPDVASLFWAGFALIIVTMIVIAAKGITGRWASAIIDESHRMSLTRLQTVMWSVLILSVIPTMIATNLALGCSAKPEPEAVHATPDPTMTAETASLRLLGPSSDRITNTPSPHHAVDPESKMSSCDKEGSPFQINIPVEIWALLGLVSATTVFSGFLTTEDAKGNDGKGGTGDSTGNTGDDHDHSKGTGKIVPFKDRTNDHQARFSDLFRGYSEQNFEFVDLSRIQLLVLSSAVVVTYGLSLHRQFSLIGPEPVSFPGFDSGLLAILAISNVGFLTKKSIDTEKFQKMFEKK